MKLENSYCFKSSQFKMIDGEEEFTNPGRFGKELADWLCQEFSNLGYESEVIPEDWGWCVMCIRGDFLLWVGCGNVLTEEVLDSTLENPPKNENLIWQVFAEIEIPFYMLKAKFKRVFGKLDIEAPLNKINEELKVILNSNDTIYFCEQP